MAKGAQRAGRVPVGLLGREGSRVYSEHSRKTLTCFKQQRARHDVDLQQHPWHSECLHPSVYIRVCAPECVHPCTWIGAVLCGEKAQPENLMSVPNEFLFVNLGPLVQPVGQQPDFPCSSVPPAQARPGGNVTLMGEQQSPRAHQLR